MRDALYFDFCHSSIISVIGQVRYTCRLSIASCLSPSGFYFFLTRDKSSCRFSQRYFGAHVRVVVATSPIRGSYRLRRCPAPLESPGSRPAQVKAADVARERASLIENAAVFENARP